MKFFSSATTPVVERLSFNSQKNGPHGEFEGESKKSSKDLRKNLGLDIFGSAIRTLFLPLLSTIFLAKEAHWLSTFVSRKLGDNNEY